MPRFVAVADLPVPPFWFTQAMTRAGGSPTLHSGISFVSLLSFGFCRGVLHCVKDAQGVADNNTFPADRHNERKNECYSNPDIELARSHLNVHFQRCDGTYERALDRMLEQGVVSTRGLKPDAKVFEEMVFDVNTAYFERHGGYDYAQGFFEEVYRFAEKEVGNEYILSAVMHADERNRALSDQMGKDVYHYHLHVIYLPVVEKHVKWSKRCRDPSLVGTTKEIIHQISHSKK
jgi:hypothetical protein